MRLLRLAVDASTFRELDSGERRALIVQDQELAAGDELFAVKTFGGEYQGGAKLLRVTHVDRTDVVRDGWCVASVAGLGR